MNDPRFPHPEKFLAGGRHFTAAEVIERLSPHISEVRRERMHQVVASRTYTITAVLDGLYDRGNVHAVLRSAEALGIQSVHIVDTSPNVKDSSRVSQGAEKWLDLFGWDSERKAIEALRERGYQILVTHLEEAEPIHYVDFSVPSAIVFGNEHEGVSAEMIEAADRRVRVPMYGFTQSFNISVAAALCFYHIEQARAGLPEGHGDLTPQQREILLADYCMRSLGAAEKILCHE